MISENKGFAFSVSEDRTNALIQAILDAVQNEILIVSTDCRVALANRIAKERIGDVDLTERGLTCHEAHYRRPYPGEPEKYPCVIREVLRTQRPVRAEHVVIDDFGNSILMEVIGRPIMDDTGNIQWIVQTLYEISKENRRGDNRSTSEPQFQMLEESPADYFQIIYKDREKLHKSNNLESFEFMTNSMAHDFSNIMVGVLSNADYLLQTVPMDSSIRECLIDISVSAKRAADLAEQMSPYSGQSGFVSLDIDLSVVFENIRLFIEKSIPAHIVLRYDIEEDLPRIQVNRSQIRRVIINLVSNAADAIGDNPGVIRISTGRMYCDAAYVADAHPNDDLKEGPYVYIDVSDTGIGMSPDTMARIFDPYYTTKFSCRGLGLAAVLSIVKSCSGAIEVFSNPGEGSTFRVLFPAKKTDAPTFQKTAPTGDRPF